MLGVSKGALRNVCNLPKKQIVDLAAHYYKPKGKDKIDARPHIVINLHGLFGSHLMFHRLNRRLIDDLQCDVVCVDLRNHGKSPKALPMDYLTMTHDVIRLIKSRFPSESRIDLVGFSMGGKIAMLASLHRSLNINKCVSIDMPPYETPTLDPMVVQNYDMILRLINRDIKIKKGSKDWESQVIELFKKVPANDGPHRTSVALYFANGFLTVKANKDIPQIGDSDPYINYNNALATVPNLLDEVKKWPVLEDDNLTKQVLMRSSDTSLLILKGEKSMFVKDDLRPIKDVFPNSKVRTFPTGHNILLEDTEASLECISSFLKE